MNEIATIQVLYDEFGVEPINVIIDSTKERLGWNDFILDFSKHTNSTLITDLFDVNKQLNNKQMQYQDLFIRDPNDKAYLTSLIDDIGFLSNRRNKITDQLCSALNDLRDIMLSKNSL